MMIDKVSNPQPKTKVTEKNPLADIAGKFGGQFWQETQSEIQLALKIDREKAETDQLFWNSESDQQD
ncbi:MAG: hypothetical protein ACRC80_15175 [Waterburya sp.]